MEMPVVPQQRESPLSFKANVSLRNFLQRQIAVIARRKDIFARCRKAVVRVGAKEVVSRNPKYARWTILQCVVVTELLMEMPVVPQQREFPSSFLANVVNSRKVAVTVRGRTMYVCSPKAIVGYFLPGTVFQSPTFAIEWKHQFAVAMESPTTMLVLLFQKVLPFMPRASVSRKERILNALSQNTKP
jgi:hypothetical protein